MKRIEIRSFAKINLGLEITGKRPDGYHTLDSLMQTIDWTDEMTIETRPGRGEIELIGDLPSVPWDERNLLHRTYQLLRERFARLDSLRIGVQKTIPPGAGLGGGSGNAGALLLHLCRRFELDLGVEERVQLAVRLGADVPFFLWGGTARVEGIGERVDALPDLGLPPFIALTPELEVSTARVFSHYSLTKQASDSTIKTFLRTADPSCLVNQLMPVTAQLYPEVSQAQEDLRRAGCSTVLMSGSGSTLLGFVSDGGAESVDIAWLKERHRRVRWCSGVTRLEYRNGVGA